MQNYMTFEKLTQEKLINVFTFKPYNFSKNLSIEEINNNYEKLKKELNKNIKIIKPHQTHTDIVKIVDENNLNDEFNNVDGLITNLKGIALATSLADCQGILLYDKKNKVIGNIHSGWKGTLNRIGEKAIKIMIKKFNTNPMDLIIVITPSILKCCFEVDLDIKEQFENEFKDIDLTDIIIKGDIKDKNQKYYIDTVNINKRVFMKLGVKEENIELPKLCSKCNNYIHSYRKDGINSGRNLSLICME